MPARHVGLEERLGAVAFAAGAPVAGLACSPRVARLGADTTWYGEEGKGGVSALADDGGTGLWIGATTGLRHIEPGTGVCGGRYAAGSQTSAPGAGQNQSECPLERFRVAFGRLVQAFESVPLSLILISPTPVVGSKVEIQATGAAPPMPLDRLQSWIEAHRRRATRAEGRVTRRAHPIERARTRPENPPLSEQDWR
jgi:hypothetical protein